MAYWLLKSEPGEWSWEDQVRVGVEPWNGVRNHQANNNLKQMREGDKAFFYHSGKGPRIVGIVTIVRAFYPDPADTGGRFGRVDVRALQPLPRPVPLKRIKDQPALADMALVRQARLSVSPVDARQWREICQLGGLADI